MRAQVPNAIIDNNFVPAGMEQTEAAALAQLVELMYSALSKDPARK